MTRGSGWGGSGRSTLRSWRTLRRGRGVRPRHAPDTHDPVEAYNAGHRENPSRSRLRSNTPTRSSLAAHQSHPLLYTSHLTSHLDTPLAATGARTSSQSHLHRGHVNDGKVRIPGTAGSDPADLMKKKKRKKKHLLFFLKEQRESMAFCSRPFFFFFFIYTFSCWFIFSGEDFDIAWGYLLKVTFLLNISSFSTFFWPDPSSRCHIGGIRLPKRFGS